MSERAMIIDSAASQSGASGWTSAFKKQSFKIFAETLAPSVMLEASVLPASYKAASRERVAGITILTADIASKISAIAIHHRPLPGAHRFSAELGRALAGKIEPDLFHCAQ
jgi:hypothetical protein